MVLLVVVDLGVVDKEVVEREAEKVVVEEGGDSVVDQVVDSVVE